MCLERPGTRKKPVLAVSPLLLKELSQGQLAHTQSVKDWETGRDRTQTPAG